MPNARRIIFGTHVIPTQSVEAEETSIRHTEFQASPNGTIGGKGIASISSTQWGPGGSDGWTSFNHPGAYWEDQTDLWETKGETWSGELSITAATNLTAAASALAFLYITNTGDTVNAEVSLTGTGGDYFIIIPPSGSVHLRGDGTNLGLNEVFVRGASGSGTTTIEYIIAQ
jgi:hypothetical protein